MGESLAPAFLLLSVAAFDAREGREQPHPFHLLLSFPLPPKLLDCALNLPPCAVFSNLSIVLTRRRCRCARYHLRDHPHPSDRFCMHARPSSLSVNPENRVAAAAAAAISLVAAVDPNGSFLSVCTTPVARPLPSLLLSPTATCTRGRRWLDRPLRLSLTNNAISQPSGNSGNGLDYPDLEVF